MLWTPGKTPRPSDFGRVFIVKVGSKTLTPRIPVTIKTDGIFQRTNLHMRQVRDGYLTGTMELLGVVFDIEAFAVEPDTWNVPLGARAARLQETLEGLLIDDLPLQQVSIPGFEGKWLMFIYPAEDPHYTGDTPA